jgi:hypothetical protein
MNATIMAYNLSIPWTKSPCLMNFLAFFLLQNPQLTPAVTIPLDTWHTARL